MQDEIDQYACVLSSALPGCQVEFSRVSEAGEWRITYRREKRSTCSDGGDTRPTEVPAEDEAVYPSSHVYDQEWDRAHLSFHLRRGGDLGKHVQDEVDDTDVEEDGEDEAP